MAISAVASASATPSPLERANRVVSHAMQRRYNRLQGRQLFARMREEKNYNQPVLEARRDFLEGLNILPLDPCEIIARYMPKADAASRQAWLLPQIALRRILQTLTNSGQDRHRQLMRDLTQPTAAWPAIAPPFAPHPNNYCLQQIIQFIRGPALANFFFGEKDRNSRHLAKLQADVAPEHLTALRMDLRFITTIWQRRQYKHLARLVQITSGEPEGTPSLKTEQRAHLILTHCPRLTEICNVSRKTLRVLRRGNIERIYCAASDARIIAELPTLPRLIALALGYISGPFPVIPQLPGLISLELCRLSPPPMSLDDVGIALRCMPNVRSLSFFLCSKLIPPTNPDAIARFKQIRHLRLSSISSIDFLVHFTGLRYLEFQGSCSISHPEAHFAPLLHLRNLFAIDTSELSCPDDIRRELEDQVLMILSRIHSLRPALEHQANNVPQLPAPLPPNLPALEAPVFNANANAHANANANANAAPAPSAAPRINPALALRVIREMFPDDRDDETPPPQGKK